MHFYCSTYSFFIFSSGIVNKILSQICGRLYFPIFLLRVGLFTLIYIDSLMVLAKLFSSLPMILKFSMDVSLLKNLVKIRKGEGIIHKAEKQLLNERIRNINYTLECYEHERYMYQNELKDLIDQEMWNACTAEIERVKELRHRRVMERQISKFNRLLLEKICKDQGGCSNYWSGCSNQHGPEMNKNITKKWVINLSNIPLTQEQEYLLAHGPNFVVTPQSHPMGST